MEHLCPHCYAVVEEHPETCPACGGGFKSPRRALVLSLIFPGLGVWYLGFRKLAVAKMLLGVLFWFSVWVPDPANPIDLSTRALVALPVLLILHLAGVAATAYLVKKGHYPGAAPAGRPAARMAMSAR